MSLAAILFFSASSAFDIQEKIRLAWGRAPIRHIIGTAGIQNSFCEKEFHPILFSALVRLVSLKFKWQRVFEHSRVRKYYQVLRILRKTFFLLGKHGTLIFKISMLFLFVGTVSSLFYLLCLKLGFLDFFQSPLWEMGRSLGSRVLLSRGLGCEGKEGSNWF